MSSLPTRSLSSAEIFFSADTSARTSRTASSLVTKALQHAVAVTLSHVLSAQRMVSHRANSLMAVLNPMSATSFTFLHRASSTASFASAAFVALGPPSISEQRHREAQQNGRAQVGHVERHLALPQHQRRHVSHATCRLLAAIGVAAGARRAELGPWRVRARVKPVGHKLHVHCAVLRAERRTERIVQRRQRHAAAATTAAATASSNVVGGVGGEVLVAKRRQVRIPRGAQREVRRVKRVALARDRTAHQRRRQRAQRCVHRVDQSRGVGVAAVTGLCEAPPPRQWQRHVARCGERLLRPTVPAARLADLPRQRAGELRRLQPRVAALQPTAGLQLVGRAGDLAHELRVGIDEARRRAVGKRGLQSIDERGTQLGPPVDGVSLRLLVRHRLLLLRAARRHLLQGLVEQRGGRRDHSLHLSSVPQHLCLFQLIRDDGRGEGSCILGILRRPSPGQIHVPRHRQCRAPLRVDHSREDLVRARHRNGRVQSCIEAREA
eukprot:scaffold72176_cov68-Phaeocystis_antarctica.AAC.5